MNLGPNQLKVFKIMAKSKRMAHAKVRVAAGLKADILEWCMKGGGTIRGTSCSGRPWDIGRPKWPHEQRFLKIVMPSLFFHSPNSR